MASAGKAAAFAAMLRVLVIALPFHRDDWRPVVWVLAVLSLVVGSALAVVQTNVKRMLAYSSISHAGFVLVGVEAAGHRAGEPDPVRACRAWRPTCSLYSVLVIGSFAVVALVERDVTAIPASIRSRVWRRAGRRWRSRSPCSCSPRRACR